MSEFKTLVHVDDKAFKNKPEGYEVPRIKHAFLNEKTIKSLDLFQLIETVLNGHTVQPGLCPFPNQETIPPTGGTREDYYKGQNVFMVDIDNKIADLPQSLKDNPPEFETPESFRQKLLEHGIRPAFFYYSFSSGDPARFRAVILSDELTGSKEQARSILAGLISLSPYADRSCVNVDKIFYGTNREKGIVKGLTDRDAINSLDDLRSFAREMKTTVKELDELAQDGIAEGQEITGHNAEAFREAERMIRDGEALQIPIGNRDNFISAYAFDRWKRYGPDGEEEVRADVLKMALHCNPPLPLPYIYKKIQSAKEAAGRKIFSRADYTAPINPIKAADEFDKLPPEEEKSANGPNNDAQGQLTQSKDNINPNTGNGETAGKKANNRMEWLKAKALENIAQYVPDFTRDIQDNEESISHTPTGISGLDNLLQGGVYPGLHILGGDTGCGKTTLALQIGDYIAKQGRDVLYFSLEMDRNELIARSISRMCYATHRPPWKNVEYLTGKDAELWKHGQDDYRDLNDPMTEWDCDLLLDANAILSPEVKEKWESETLYKVMDIIGDYRATIGPRLQYICEIGSFNTNEINEMVEHHVAYYQDEETGKIPKDRKPVVIIDYLQILAPNPGEERLSDKQRIDSAVLELKRISRRYDVPIIALSSFNRSSYFEPVELTSFKESGAIEYTADTIWGLQLDGLDYEQFDPHRSYRIIKLRELADSRKRDGDYLWLKFKVLKNRRGITDDFAIDYNAKFNTFKPGNYHLRDEIKQIAQEVNQSKKDKDKSADSEESTVTKKEAVNIFFQSHTRT